MLVHDNGDVVSGSVGSREMRLGICGAQGQQLAAVDAWDCPRRPGIW